MLGIDLGIPSILPSAAILGARGDCPHNAASAA
jgi:hypothetical protein